MTDNTVRDPVPGWENRLLKFKSGQTTWVISGHEKDSDDPLPPLFPWPLEWVDAVLLSKEQREELNQPSSVLFQEGVSEISGQPYTKGHGVKCVRCGIKMHDGPEANMPHGFAFPYCDPCGPEIVKLFASKPNL